MRDGDRKVRGKAINKGNDRKGEMSGTELPESGDTVKKGKKTRKCLEGDDYIYVKSIDHSKRVCVVIRTLHRHYTHMYDNDLKATRWNQLAREEMGGPEKGLGVGG